MPQVEAIFKNSQGRRFPRKTECTDSGVGEDEIQEAAQDDFSFTEFSYFRDMEIFHSAVNEKYVSTPGLLVCVFAIYLAPYPPLSHIIPSSHPPRLSWILHFQSSSPARIEAAVKLPPQNERRLLNVITFFILVL
jgi:hypothetical protein